MAECVMKYIHTPGAPGQAKTVLGCDGGCDPLYRKVVTGTGRSQTTSYQAVTRTCKLVTPVSWDEKGRKFKLMAPICICVIDDPTKNKCRYVVTESDPQDPTKIIKAKCEGDCEPLYQDNQGQQPVTGNCSMILDNGQIKCVCTF